MIVKFSRQKKLRNQLTLFLLLIFQFGFGQESQLIDSLNLKSVSYRKIEPDSSFLFAKMALGLSREYSLRDKEFESLSTLCLSCYLNQDFDRAIQYCEESFDLSDIDEVRKTECFIYHGLTHVHLGNYNEAISSFLAYVEIARRNNDDRLVADGLSNLGLAYLNDGNLVKAANYYRTSIGMQKKFEPTPQLGYSYQNYARVMMNLSKYDSAEFYFDKALDIAANLKIRNIEYWVYAYREFLPKYTRQDQIEMKKKALAIAMEENLGHEITAMNYGIAELLIEAGDIDEALAYFQQSIKYGMMMENFGIILRSYNMMARAMVTAGRFEESRAYLSKYEILKDSISQYDVQSFESIMGANELVTQEREIEQIKDRLIASQAVNRQNQIALIAAILFIILIGIILFMNIKASKVKSRNNLELRVLNEMLDVAIKEKDILTGMIVHDIRSPFNKIEALMQLFQMDEKVSDNQREIMDTMMTVIDDSRVLTNELLEINKIDADKIDIKPEEIELEKFVNELLLQYESTAHSKDITLVKKFDLKAKSINSSRNVLQRIIENLVSNAVKYTPIGGNVSILISTDGESLTLVVKDDGPGIPEKEQGLLFKKFGRTSAKPTADESSTGLGLYIVEKMCQNLNGTVSLDSGAGQGAKFTVELPMSAK